MFDNAVHTLNLIDEINQKKIIVTMFSLEKAPNTLGRNNMINSLRCYDLFNLSCILVIRVNQQL